MQLLPWEVLQGLKMDLNRPFGAGPYSTNGKLIPAIGGTPLVSNSIPDQPGTTGERLPQYANSSGTISTQFNYSADAGAVSGGTDSLAARQLYARHLYVLAMVLSDSAAIANDLNNEGQSNTPADVAHLLAQWAVNVVAYRDHNNIMIPFVYDPNPFSGNGWGPDVNPQTYNTPQYTVWGCKRPELLITETLAFHDRRTQDLSNEVLDKTKLKVYGVTTYSRSAAGPTNAPQTSGKKDPGFNSAYRPQGSLFVELFNPWTSLEPRTTDLGPSPPTNPQQWPNGGVQLTKMTSAVGGRSSPVWRLIIVDPSKQPSGVLPPANGDELPDPDNPTIGLRPTIERVVYFVPLSSNPTKEGQVAYYPSATNSYNPTTVVVPPGGYAVVGSGDPFVANRTYIGFPSTGQPSTGVQIPPTTARWVSMTYKDVTTTDPRVVRSSVDRATGANPPQVLGIDQAFPNGNGNGASQRLSISEPVGGYAQYEKQPSGNGSNNGTPATFTASTGKYNVTLDIPVDQQRTLVSNETFGTPPTPIWTILNTNGTVPAFRIIYLQRLADPTRPWAPDVSVPGSTPPYNSNPQTWNPYRTIDAMTVDLTTFNGVTSAIDTTSPNNGAWNGHFESHQRGEKNYLPGNPPATGSAVGEVNLWKQEPALKGTPSPVPPSQVPGWSAVGWTGSGTTPTSTYFNQALNQTLGYLNQSFGTAATSPAGDPQYPFPWLNWSYRPFNNAYELLLVPTVSSSRLLARSITYPRRYFSYVDSAVRGQTDPSPNPPGGNFRPQPVYDGSISAKVPYPHLLNFFESSESSGPLQSQSLHSAQLHRLFAYVGVPSRFSNAQLQMRPDLAGQSGAPAHFFHTPFNRISRYREPGLINLNTVTSPDVLLGAMNMYLAPLVMPPPPPTTPPQNSPLNPVFWDKFVRSRAGDGEGSFSNNVTEPQTLNNMLRINPQFPSRFMRPFRTPGGAFLTAPPLTAGVSAEPARETDVTLFRGDPDVLTASGSTARPLFEMDDYLMGPTSSPTNAPPAPPNTAATPDKFTVSGGTYAACMDFNRNPYFRYQALQKLGSVVSNHSNVFAVWITVGYFEVTPWPSGADAGHPDGFQLGQELGSDTGDIVRHRAFYIFDRSIPVGFIRGQDLNQDKATLLKRFIE
ncbi:MAG: hypothetical protein ACLP9L_30690 [Thermoguttaceae bacterium]